jgi:hypothetical protein
VSNYIFFVTHLVAASTVHHPFNNFGAWPITSLKPDFYDLQRVALDFSHQFATAFPDSPLMALQHHASLSTSESGKS